MSRWPELDWRPFPSLTPLFLFYKRARLYLELNYKFPLSVVRAPIGATVLTIRWLLTVIRDSLYGFPYNGQNLRFTKGVLYH